MQTLLDHSNGLEYPTGMAFDGAGNLYVTDFEGDRILKRDANTGAVTIFSDDSILDDGHVYNSPESIAFDKGYGLMYVSDANREGTGGGINVVSTSTGKGAGYLPLPASQGSEGTGESDWLAFNSAGTLFMTNENPEQGIMQVNTASGDIVTPSLVPNLPDTGYALSVDSRDDVWVADSSQILVYDEHGNQVGSPITNSAFHTVFAAVFDVSGQQVYIGDLSTGTIFDYDLNGHLRGSFQAGTSVGGLAVVGAGIPPNPPPSPKPPPTGQYVALGDSYSSGEGNPPFESGTDTNKDHCHRSDAAYPNVIANDGRAPSPLFYACSGATVFDFFANNPDNPGEMKGQLYRLSSKTTLVTFSVGGDDIGFHDIAQTCYLNDLNNFSTVVSDGGSSDCHNLPGFDAGILKKIVQAGLLLRVLGIAIRERAPMAKVVVLGYPRLFPIHPTQACSGLFTGDQVWANDIVQKLDGVIAQAASSNHFQYVSQSYNAFDGHELCSAASLKVHDCNINYGELNLDPNCPYAYEINPNVFSEASSYSLHPNVNGQLRFAQIVEANLPSS